MKKLLSLGLLTVLVMTLMAVGATATISLNYVDPTPANNSGVVSYIINTTITSNTTSTYTVLNKDDSILAWYSLNNVSTSAYGVYDSSGHGYHANITGTDFFQQEGLFGNSTRFLGTPATQPDIDLAGFTKGSVFGTNTDTHFGLSMWVRFEGGAPAAEWMIDLNGGQATSGIYLREFSSSIGLAYSTGSALSNLEFGIGSRESNANVWKHYAVTYNGTHVVVYVDGQFVASQAAPLINLHTPSSVSPKIGCRSISTYYCLNGSIDEVILFTRNLLPDEIKSLYNSSSYALEQQYTISDTNDVIKAHAMNNLGEVDSTPEYSYSNAGISILYPQSKQTFQRSTSTQGVVTFDVSGSGASGDYSYRYIDADGGSYSSITSITQKATIGDQTYLNFTLPVGEWNVTILDTQDYSLNATINLVRVGDIYVITGQSNALGISLNSYSFDSTNDYLVYEWISGQWTAPTATRYWVPVFDNLTREENIPISFVNLGVGGVTITTWLPGGDNWNAMIGNISLFTNGTQKIGSVLMYQGESDTILTELGAKTAYANYAANVSSVFTMYKEGVIMAQINTRGESDANILYKIRRPQSQLWAEDPLVFRGPTTYDINLSQDGIHFRTKAESDTIADRWLHCITAAVYGGSSCKGPGISSVYLNTPTSIRVILDSSSYVSRWDDVTNTTVNSFELYNGTHTYNLTNGFMTSARLLSLTTVELNFSTSVNNTNEGWYLQYGTQMKGYDKYVLRNSLFLPADIVWNYTIAASAEIITPDITQETCSNIFSILPNYAALLPVLGVILASMLIIAAILSITVFREQGVQILEFFKDQDPVVLMSTVLSFLTILVVGIIILGRLKISAGCL